MNYRRTDVLAGSIIADTEHKAYLEKTLAERKWDLQTLVDITQSRLKQMKPKLEALIERIDWEEVILQSEVDDAVRFSSENKRHELYGFASYPRQNLAEEIYSLQDRISEWDYSPLTVFLSSIDDEFVTDAGIKTAGFTHNGLGKLVVLAKKGEMNGSQEQG